jgi:hypothetical protein
MKNQNKKFFIYYNIIIMDTTKRHFKVVIGNTEHGLYISSSPSSAARKAVSKLCANDKKRKVKFYMREITNGSKKKTYGPYLGEMKKLAKPIELKGRVIRYKTEVVKINEKKSKQKGGTTPIVLEGNGYPYKTIVLQYDGLYKQLHIYLSIERVNVIPDRNEIPFESIKTLTNFEDMIKHSIPFKIDYLIWISIPRTDIAYRKQELLKIFKKFCKGYSELNKNSPEFIELISSIEKMIPNSNKV